MSMRTAVAAALLLAFPACLASSGAACTCACEQLWLLLLLALPAHCLMRSNLRCCYPCSSLAQQCLARVQRLSHFCTCLAAMPNARPPVSAQARVPAINTPQVALVAYRGGLIRFCCCCLICCMVLAAALVSKRRKGEKVLSGMVLDCVDGCMFLGRVSCAVLT